MQHKVNLEEISDGTLYSNNDMIHIGCDGCNGNASCCRFAEDTITLDPYDLFRLQQATGLSVEVLYNRQLIALSPSDGLLLLHLNFSKETHACPFLLESGRCSIHAHRPGLCRLFPLARLIDDDKVQYLMQIHECPCTTAPKTKIKKWLELPDIDRYEAYLIHWNKLLAKTRRRLAAASGQAELTAITTEFLQNYYFISYDTTRSFYEQWEQRSCLHGTT